MKYLKLLLILIILSCCGKNANSPFTGYLVYKEYTPEHLSCDDVKTYTYGLASYAHPSITRSGVVRGSDCENVEPEYIFYLANKTKIKSFRVSNELFFAKDCGDKITLTP